MARTVNFRTVALLALATLASHPIPSPMVVMPQAVPFEVRRLVDQSTADFEAAFPARSECLTPVAASLVVDLEEDADARYSRRLRTISIRIPTSPARFPEALTHELAHHLDETCASLDQLRARFLELQGFEADASWTDGMKWGEIPAEHFAEAVVELVRHDRIVHADRITIDGRTLDLLRSWGGDPGVG